MLTKLKNLSIKIKLFAGFGIVCLAIIIEGIILNNFNNSTIDEIIVAEKNILPHTLNYFEIKWDIGQIQNWLTDISATRAAKGFDDGFNEAEKYYQDAVSRIESAIIECKKYGEDDVATHLKNLLLSLEDYYNMGKQMAKSYIDQGPEQGNLMMEKFDPFAEKLASLTNDLVHKQVDKLNNSLASMENHARSKSRVMLIIEAVVILLSIFFALFVVVPISSGLKHAVSRLEDIATDDADLTERLLVKSKDEIGNVGKWFNLFIQRIHDIIIKIGLNAEMVSASSRELVYVSKEMSDSADELFGNATTVAAASEEMSSNMNSVAAASEQASTNIGIVADSATQMQETLGKVAINCEKAKKISDDASSSVDEANTRVKFLGNAAKDISKVTDVITEIAEQINLLALNATIEAARAGEAGKGFAVVAEEIKSLAGQTAIATEDIRAKVTSIQDSTGNTVQDVSKISEVISGVNSIVTTISVAIEEQSESATMVAQNIEQASAGIGEVNTNVAQSSQVASEISKAITGVNEVAEGISERGGRIRGRALELSELSSQSSDMISLFKVSIKELSDDEKSNFDRTDVPDLIAFGPKFILGIDEIDKQHKVWFSHTNKLHKAMKLQKGSQKVGEIIDGFLEYMVFHFGYEENYFARYAYPETKQHIEHHKGIVTKINEFKTQFENGNAAVTIELMDFLAQWLENHILKEDKKYIPFLKDKMVEA